MLVLYLDYLLVELSADNVFVLGVVVLRARTRVKEQLAELLLAVVVLLVRDFVDCLFGVLVTCIVFQQLSVTVNVPLTFGWLQSLNPSQLFGSDSDSRVTQQRQVALLCLEPVLTCLPVGGLLLDVENAMIHGLLSVV